MARGINKVILIGNLGSDPEVRYSASGVAVTRFRIATSESWRDRQTNEQKENTEWHSIVCFQRLAEIAAEYLRKGSKVYIEGRLKTDSWETPEGQKRYRTEINARELQMLDSRQTSGAPMSSGMPAGGAMPPDVGNEMQTQKPPANKPPPSPPPAGGDAGAPAYDEPDDDIPF